jgi:hypothetical protein
MCDVQAKPSDRPAGHPHQMSLATAAAAAAAAAAAFQPLGWRHMNSKLHMTSITGQARRPHPADFYAFIASGSRLLLLLLL